MTTQDNVTLSKLSDTGQTVSNAADDIRGRKVKDKDGNDLGKVDDLLIDDQERKVRFLRVEHGGFLGVGETKSFIPVDAITKITDDVHTTLVTMSPKPPATTQNLSTTRRTTAIFTGTTATCPSGEPATATGTMRAFSTLLERPPQNGKSN